MYELIQVSENTFYVQSPAKIGIIKTGEDRVCLIDSGNDKDAAKKVLRILEEKGWTLQAICNTHSHADHIGGNQFLQSKTGCRIFIYGKEHGFAAYPILEPAFLYGGNPPTDLKHKFLMAKESNVDVLNESCLPNGMSFIDLPGHSWDMVGYRTPDNIVFLADCLSSQETLDKYQVSYIVDIASYLDTLKKIQTIDAKLFIPSHAEPTDNIAPLAEKNIEKVYEIADSVKRFCKTAASFETVLKQLFETYSIPMNFEQYALIGNTVRSYLTWLKETGNIEAVFEDNTLLWRTVE